MVSIPVEPDTDGTPYPFMPERSGSGKGWFFDLDTYDTQGVF
jgi:hypothetical protein